MIEQMKTEYRRMFRAASFWIALGLGSIIAIAQIVFVVYPLSLHMLQFYTGHTGIPPSVYTKWLGQDGATAYHEIYRISIPIIAMLPHALSYYFDKKQGYIKNIYTRTKKKNYLVAKYIVTFTSGGIAVCIPYCINFWLSSCLLPQLIPVRNGMAPLVATSVFQSIYYRNPLLYTIIFMGILFVYSGVFATTALAAVTFVDNVFLLSMFPFLLWYGLGSIDKYFFESSMCTINPMLLSDMAVGIHVPVWYILIYIVILGALSAALYFWNGERADVF